MNSNDKAFTTIIVSGMVVIILTAAISRWAEVQKAKYQSQKPAAVEVVK